MKLKVQTNSASCTLASLAKEYLKLMKLYFLLRIIDMIFVKFTRGVSARATSQDSAWNTFLLLM